MSMNASEVLGFNDLKFGFDNSKQKVKSNHA